MLISSAPLFTGNRFLLKTQLTRDNPTTTYIVANVDLPTGSMNYFQTGIHTGNHCYPSWRILSPKTKKDSLCRSREELMLLWADAHESPTGEGRGVKREKQGESKGTDIDNLFIFVLISSKMPHVPNCPPIYLPFATHFLGKKCSNGLELSVQLQG